MYLRKYLDKSFLPKRQQKNADLNFQSFHF